MSAEFVVATRNAHKLRELGEALPGLTLLPLPEEVELPPEDGDTFEANAFGKARAARAATGLPAIADDSGIAAAALDGAPGVYSARFAGPDATDAQNLNKLMSELDGADDRSVAYVCSLVLVDDSGAEHAFEAQCEGQLAGFERGDGGFGYDPAFLPADLAEGDERTMAELSPDEKHAISHRGKAARMLAAHLAARPAPNPASGPGAGGAT